MGLKALLPTLSTRQVISVFKGCLAYTLAFVFIFLRKFNATNDYPVVLTSMILVTIAGTPGVSVGGCIDGGLLGMAGVGFGALGFLILAKLGHTQVGQGFVFFVILYVLATIKAQAQRYFAFSLLAIIMSFSGIYTSVLLGGQFSPKYVEAYLEAYCWGFAIVLGVNILVFPISSEYQLRELLVLSLEHVSTFAHLIAKTYDLQISDEERVVRDALNQTIRADLAFLGQKLGETGLEINWTRWSVADYGTATQKIRSAQQALITSYSSLVTMERHDPATLASIQKGLLDSNTANAFSKLRRGMDLAIADIVRELAVGKTQYHSPAPGSRSWDDFVDADRDEKDSEDPQGRPRASTVVSQSSPEATAKRLLQVTTQLHKEVEGFGATPVGSRRGSFSRDRENEKVGSNDGTSGGTTAAPSDSGAPLRSKPSTFQPLDRVGFLRSCWKSFEKSQNAAVVQLLADALHPADELKLHQPGPSISDQFSRNRPGGWPGLFGPSPLHKRPNATKVDDPPESEGERVQEEIATEEAIRPPLTGSEARAELCSSTVMRVFSFLFGMGQLVEELTALHEYIVPQDGVQRRKKTLHIHWFEKIPSPAKVKINRPQALAEALAKIRGVDYSIPKISFGARIAKLEQLARSDTSIYAFKTACAVSVFTVFILAPSLKSFFVAYGLTGGLITIVVAMAPTMGQTFLTFVLQILGTGFGSIFGMVVLYIFKGVGGFYFNPYGIVCLLAIYAIPMCWIIYTKPQFFAGALLAMNGTGSLIVTEWVYREIPGQIRPTFDHPALRMSKALVAMSLALGIAGIFQIFILRTPARQTLRVKLSEITLQLGSYNVLLAVLTEAVVPTIASARVPPPEAVAALRAELVAREVHIQMDLLSLMPLLKFGAAEPSFGQPFQGATLSRIIKIHQIILDRLREARTAVGVQGFSDDVRSHFTDRLAPYRRQSRRFSRALFYLVHASLSTKAPLPLELPSMSTTARMIQHDAMVLSHRLTKEPNGLEILQSGAFIRWWFFLVSLGSVSHQLESLETELRVLFGEVTEEEMLLASAK